MPTHLHEMLIELFRARPALAAELLAGALGVEVPVHEQVRSDPADLPDLLPTEYRADAVVVLVHDDEPVMAVVVEIQLRRDGDKRWSWPVYITTLRARLRCPVELLVVCPEAGIAAWCATPILLGPELVPVVSDAEQASRMPELAVLSAMAQVYAALPESARRHLEELMSTDTGEELSLLAQWYVARGEARGEANAVLAFLDARQIEVPDATRALITGCQDLAQLDAWVRRAATAAKIDDLFA